MRCISNATGLLQGTSSVIKETARRGEQLIPELRDYRIMKAFSAEQSVCVCETSYYDRYSGNCSYLAVKL